MIISVIEITNTCIMTGWLITIQSHFFISPFVFPQYTCSQLQHGQLPHGIQSGGGVSCGVTTRTNAVANLWLQRATHRPITTERERPPPIGAASTCTTESRDVPLVMTCVVLLPYVSFLHSCV